MKTKQVTLTIPEAEFEQLEMEAQFLGVPLASHIEFFLFNYRQLLNEFQAQLAMFHGITDGGELFGELPLPNLQRVDNDN